MQADGGGTRAQGKGAPRDQKQLCHFARRNHFHLGEKEDSVVSGSNPENEAGIAPAHDESLHQSIRERRHPVLALFLSVQWVIIVSYIMDSSFMGVGSAEIVVFFFYRRERERNAMLIDTVLRIITTHHACQGYLRVRKGKPLTDT
jgi:hypothetical protein